MNFLILVGRIKEHPVLEETTNGLTYCNLLVETLDGDEKPGDLFKVTLWKQVAEYIRDNGKVGDPIAIKARLKPNNYTRESGEILYRPEIIAEKVSLIDLH